MGGWLTSGAFECDGRVLRNQLKLICFQCGAATLLPEPFVLLRQWIDRFFDLFLSHSSGNLLTVSFVRSDDYIRSHAGSIR